MTDTAPVEDYSLPMDRAAAWELVLQYNSDQSQLNHYLESEVVMRALARKLGEDEEYWGMLGLLHDLDWGETKQTPELHCTRTPDMLRKAGFNEFFIHTITTHGYGTECGDGKLWDLKRTTKLQHALAAAETVTGLVYASALMREDKIASLSLKSLKKKYKNKKFAATVNREVIKECEHLDIELDEFLQLSIDAIRDIADQIGLA